MFKAWKHFWDRFLNNEAYFIARVRTLVMVVGASGGLFGKQLADALGSPRLEAPFKVAAVVCMGLSLLMRAGDKTPANVKELADEIKPQGP